MNSSLEFWFLILWLGIGVSGFWARTSFGDGLPAPLSIVFVIHVLHTLVTGHCLSEPKMDISCTPWQAWTSLS